MTERDAVPEDLAYTSDAVCAFFTEYADGRTQVCGRISGHGGRHWDDGWFGPGEGI